MLLFVRDLQTYQLKQVCCGRLWDSSSCPCDNFVDRQEMTDPLDHFGRADYDNVDVDRSYRQIM
jgi:hypothetical protein